MPAPQRPDHPHMNLLIEMVNELDSLADEHPPTEESDPVGHVLDRERIDADSVSYMAVQRGIRGANATLPQFATMLTVPMSGMWLEGFIVGYLFALNRTDLP